MAESDRFTVEVALSNRKAMSAGSKRTREGTFHHVLPVRTFYLMSWTLLAVAADRRSATPDRAVLCEALLSMCHYEGQRAKIRKWVNAPEAVNGDIADLASYCTTPVFGGFFGPKPSQRKDDPQGNRELVKPRSADPGWWTSLSQLRGEILSAFGLADTPDPDRSYSTTHDFNDWVTLCLRVADKIMFARSFGTYQSDRSDWRLIDAGAWGYLRKDDVAVRGQKLGKKMRLISQTERPCFVDDRASPRARDVSWLTMTRGEYFHAVPV